MQVGSFFSLLLPLAGLAWWGVGDYEQVSKTDVQSIVATLGYVARDVTSGASDPALEVISPSSDRIRLYLGNCQVASANFDERCSKIKLKACWFLSGFGFQSTKSVFEFATEFNRYDYRRFEIGYAYITPDRRAVCLQSSIYLNGGASGKYVASSVQGYIKAVDEFKAFAHNWR
jgi:hypothetical protein